MATSELLHGHFLGHESTDIVSKFCINASQYNISDQSIYGLEHSVHLYSGVRHHIYPILLAVALAALLINVPMAFTLKYLVKNNIVKWTHIHLILSMMTIDVIACIVVVINASMHIGYKDYGIGSLSGNTSKARYSRLAQMDNTAFIATVFCPLMAHVCQAVLQCIAIYKPLFYKHRMNTHTGMYLAALNWVFALVIFVSTSVATEGMDGIPGVMTIMRNDVSALFIFLTTYLGCCIVAMGAGQALASRAIVLRMRRQQKAVPKRFKVAAIQIRVQLAVGLVMLALMCYCTDVYFSRYPDISNQADAKLKCSGGLTYFRDILTTLSMFYIAAAVWTTRLIYEPLIYLRNPHVKGFLKSCLVQKRIAFNYAASIRVASSRNPAGSQSSTSYRT